MKNYVQQGERMRLFCADSVKSGELVVVNDLVGVACNDYDIEDGDGVVCAMSGIFDGIPKATEAWEQGQPLYYNAANKQVVRAESGPLVGHAADVTTADSSTGAVRLKG